MKTKKSTKEIVNNVSNATADQRRQLMDDMIIYGMCAYYEEDGKIIVVNPLDIPSDIPLENESHNN
jgi:hypothetical protein